MLHARQIGFAIQLAYCTQPSGEPGNFLLVERERFGEQSFGTTQTHKQPSRDESASCVGLLQILDEPIHGTRGENVQARWFLELNRRCVGLLPRVPVVQT